MPATQADRLTRQRLREEFPGVDPPYLDDLLDMHDGDYRQVLRVLEGTRGELPLRTAAIRPPSPPAAAVSQPPTPPTRGKPKSPPQGRRQWKGKRRSGSGPDKVRLVVELG